MRMMIATILIVCAGHFGVITRESSPMIFVLLVITFAVCGIQDLAEIARSKYD